MVVNWFKLKYPRIMIVASANGGSRNPIEAKNLKMTGILAGWPDLQIAKASQGYHGLYIEMKAPATAKTGKGRLTTLQKDCLDYLNKEGYHAVPAWGFEEARRIIDWYLE